MDNSLLLIPLCWFGFISLLTAIITVTDKIKARRGSYRIPEKVLFILAFLGGSVAEYFTMRLIRHKTLHKRFMIGLPIMIILQIAALSYIFITLYST